MMHLLNYGAVAALFCGSYAALAQPVAAQTLAEAVSRCRAIGADGDRLACFDRAAVLAGPARTGATGGGAAGGERAAGFGLPVRAAPALPEGTDALDSTVASVARWQRDRVTVTLADGSVWRTTEQVPVPPEVGERVHIRRASLGSYLARFDQGRGVRIMRLR